MQVLADYFTGEHDFNLLCSVFMIVFMVQVTLTNTHQHSPTLTSHSTHSALKVSINNGFRDISQYIEKKLNVLKVSTR